MNLFEREVWVATFLRRLCVPFYRQWSAFNRRTVERGKRDIIRLQHGNLALFQDENAPCIFEKRGNIGREVLLVFAEPDDQRAASATCAEQQIRLLAADHGDGI